MAKIAFMPLPEIGHVNPTVKLARDLKQRGHQISYLGIVDHEEYISSQGLGFTSIFSRACPKGSSARYAKMKLTAIDMLMGLGEGALSNPLEEIGSILTATRPDLLIIDLALRDLALVARKAGIQCALISTALQDVRLRLVDTKYDPATELPVLVLCPREFDFPNATQMKGRYYIESSVEVERQEPGQFPWDRLDEAKPLIYCSLGSHCQDYKESEPFFRAVIEMMKEKPSWQLVLATGPHMVLADLQAVPQNALVVHWAPQMAILKKSSMMITHGGLGTVKECILLGVPMIVFPVKFDQPQNAARVVYHGLGLRADIRDASVRRIHDLVDRIHGDPSFKRKVESMRKDFERIENSGIGPRIVEGILAGLQNSGNLLQPSA